MRHCSLGPLPWLAGALVLVAYIFTAGPSFFWLDSGEFVAAAWGLGVAHPPGHPLPSLFGRLIGLLPVGTIAFRVTLASALEAAAATALMSVLCHDLLLRLRRAGDGGFIASCPPRLLASAATVAALVLGLSYALWFQAVRAEVYALNVLLIIAGVLCVLRWEARGDRRYLLGAGLACGLGLCNHHFLVILCLPVVGIFVLIQRRAGPGLVRTGVGLVLAAVLGLSTLAYLPLRAAQAPEANWGHPTTLHRFAWVVSARTFHKSMDHAATESVGHRGVGGVFTVARGICWDSALAPLVGLLALLGHYLIWRRRQTWKVGLLLTGIAGFNLASPLTVGLDTMNPDAYGYLAVAVAFLCPGIAVIIAAGAGLIGSRYGARAAAALCGLTALLPLYQTVLNLPQCDLRGHWSTEASTRELLAQQPPGALLMTSYFETIFNVWALHVGGDLRPDVEVFHRNFVGHEGYIEQVAVRHPGLLTAARRAKAGGGLQIADLDDLAASRPVRIEYDLNLPLPVSERLSLAGLAQAYTPKGGTSGGSAHHVARMERWRRSVLSATGSRSDNQTRRSVVWANFLLARLACSRPGLESAARYHLKVARALAPRDHNLAALARRCKPTRDP
jgi:Protein O-mannosyl-transferase TMEM260-like